MFGNNSSPSSVVSFSWCWSVCGGGNLTPATWNIGCLRIQNWIRLLACFFTDCSIFSIIMCNSQRSELFVTWILMLKIRNPRTFACILVNISPRTYGCIYSIFIHSSKVRKQRWYSEIIIIHKMNVNIAQYIVFLHNPPSVSKTDHIFGHLPSHLTICCSNSCSCEFFSLLLS